MLTAGSCDVDNFGDLLFFLITERYLRDAQVVPAGPFGWDMNGIMDERIRAFGPLLSSEQFDVIWTVGGERAWGTLEDAFRISAPEQLYRRYEQASPAERRCILESVSGATSMVDPYLPSPIDHPLNAGAPSVVNSVGISDIRGLSPSRQREYVSLLAGTTFLSVRDDESSDLLRKHGIDHELAPDAVHALSIVRPVDDTQRTDTAIIQVNGAVLADLGTAAVARSLIRNPDLRGLRIRVLLAGTYRDLGDSRALDEELVDAVTKLAPGTDITIIDDRRPLDLVDHISRARIVIGTSLHLRITACAYNVPRVTLKIGAKQTRYLTLWDPYMPCDVALGNLDDATSAALAAARRREVRQLAARTSDAAHAHLKSLAEAVLALVESETYRDREQRAQRRAGLDGHR
ncbi:polysaccharide pyruvyl transferase family protein [Jiangella alba]|uniref:polysaccharide pyruvyl transferase family protein n=1 Tax=Jiangella alba TaxID=561176 RepID=UPI00083F242E|nr:polysaccharide pyruvyl transferase family protein [Jiangella alba]